MACLIDTGVLLRAFDGASSEYQAIRRAFRKLWSRQDLLIVAVQNLAEFWNVSTRPIDKNGYGLTAARAGKRLAASERICQVIPESEDTFRVWKQLVFAHDIVGVAVLDARLVSVMITHGISTVMTLNAQDFRRYAGITAIIPADV